MQNIISRTERDWYYVQGNQQVGPVPESQLLGLLAAGSLAPATLVWTDLLTDWVPAAQCGALAAALPARPQAQPQSAPALSPSDLMLLNADRFAQRAGVLGNGNFDLLWGEGSVSNQALATAVYAAAFLASEQAGVLRLVSRTKKAMLGLRSVPILVAEPTGGAIPWPAGSMEEAIASQLSRGPVDVEELVVALLKIDTSNGWAQAVDLLVESLGARGLLVAEKTKKLLVTWTKWKALDQTMAFAQSQDTSWIAQALAACQQQRPELWRLLTGAITKAVYRRTESPDLDFDTD